MGTAKEGKTTSGTSMTNIDIEKLDTDNYAVWSVKMKAFLIFKELSPARRHSDLGQMRRHWLSWHSTSRTTTCHR